MLAHFFSISSANNGRLEVSNLTTTGDSAQMRAEPFDEPLTDALVQQVYLASG